MFFKDFKPEGSYARTQFLVWSAAIAAIYIVLTTIAAGFGIGTERIIMELANQGIELPEPAPCAVYVANLGEEARTAAYLLCQGLREKGIQTEQDLCGRSLKAQFKYADKLNAKYIALVGGDELREQGK